MNGFFSFLLRNKLVLSLKNWFKTDKTKDFSSPDTVYCRHHEDMSEEVS